MSIIDRIVWTLSRQQLVHRGKSPLLRYLRKRHPDLVTTTRVRRGIKLELDATDTLQNVLLFTGNFEPDTTWFMERYLTGIRSAVDLGCNVGYFSCYLQSLSGGQLDLTSIDANPWACERTRKHLTMNGYGGRVINSAVGDHEGTVTLTIPRTHRAMASLSAAGLPADSDAIDVPMKRLDALLDEHGVGTPDFFKMDIEGAEPLAFAGASPAFWRSIRVVLFEYHSARFGAMGFGMEDVWRHLPTDGARLGFLRPGRLRVNWVQSTQDIEDGTDVVIVRD